MNGASFMSLRRLLPGIALLTILSPASGSPSTVDHGADAVSLEVNSTADSGPESSRSALTRAAETAERTPPKVRTTSFRINTPAAKRRCFPRTLRFSPWAISTDLRRRCLSMRPARYGGSIRVSRVQAGSLR